MVKCSTLFAAGLMAFTACSVAPAWAASCSEVEAITLKTLAKVLQVEERSLTPMTKLLGPLQLTETLEEQLTSELEKDLKISEDAWHDDTEWKTVEDILSEVRVITACSAI